MSRPERGRPGRAASGGFTQIEVLTAMLIIGLVTPFLMGGVMGGLTHARHSQDVGVATAWAQSEIELLRQRCFADLAPSARKVTAATLQGGELPPPPGFAAGYVVIEPAGPSLLKVSVSLHRQDWDGAVPIRPPYASTTTYVADVRLGGICP